MQNGNSQSPQIADFESEMLEQRESTKLIKTERKIVIELKITVERKKDGPYAQSQMEHVGVHDGARTEPGGGVEIGGKRSGGSVPGCGGSGCRQERIHLGGSRSGPAASQRRYCARNWSTTTTDLITALSKNAEVNTRALQEHGT